MEKLSLILSDLDGTLFRSDRSISGRTKQAIRAIQERGILFGICTSRAYANALPFLEGIEPDIFITNGGGMVRCRGEKIYASEFSAEEARTLIDAAFSVFGADAVISADNEDWLCSNSPDELGDSFWTFNDFSDFHEPCMKICIKTTDAQKVSKVASSVGLDKIDILPFSDIPWFKLSQKSATKENAISALCSHLKISLSQVSAFGDDFNDIGMLKLCGRGIAMQNAIDEVKRIADEICPSNDDDGVAQWLLSALNNAILSPCTL